MTGQLPIVFLQRQFSRTASAGGQGSATMAVAGGTDSTSAAIAKTSPASKIRDANEVSANLFIGQLLEFRPIARAP
jgi:hypothetical protein